MSKVISKRKYKKMSPKERRILWWKVNYKKILGIFIGTAAVVAIVVGIVLTVEPKDNYNTFTNNPTNASNPTMLYFGSTSCVPCQQMQPILADLRADYSAQVNIKTYDVWNTTEGQTISNNYGIPTIPSMVLLDKNGNEVARFVGGQPYSTIVQKYRDLGWI